RRVRLRAVLSAMVLLPEPPFGLTNATTCGPPLPVVNAGGRVPNVAGVAGRTCGGGNELGTVAPAAGGATPACVVCSVGAYETGRSLCGLVRAATASISRASRRPSGSGRFGGVSSRNTKK